MSGETQLDFDPLSEDAPVLAMLPVRSIEPDVNQPRKQLGDLADLALSIRENGLVQPIVVEPVAGGRYRILAGARRHAACASIGLQEMPCIVRTVEAQSRLELQLIENLHRKDLSPLEEAEAFKRLMVEFNLTQRDLARRLGKSLTSVNETLRILDIPPELLEDVRTSEQASKSVLLEIAKQPDLESQKAAIELAKQGNLPVSQARERKKGGQSKKGGKVACTIDLGEALVSIRFRDGDSSDQRILDTLELALNHCRIKANS